MLVTSAAKDLLADKLEGLLSRKGGLKVESSSSSARGSRAGSCS